MVNTFSSLSAAEMTALERRYDGKIPQAAIDEVVNRRGAATTKSTTRVALCELMDEYEEALHDARRVRNSTAIRHYMTQIENTLAHLKLLDANKENGG